MFYKIIVIIALAFPLVVSANSEQACRNKFNNSQASNHCNINAFIKVEKPGQYWQCHMQLHCSAGNYWVSSGWQLNLLSSLHYCAQNNDVQYGSC